MKGERRSSLGRPRSDGNGLRKAHRSADRPRSAITMLATQVKELSARVDQMERELDHVKRAWGRMGTPRQGVREQVEKNGADLGVQFQRIAAMQAEIDLLKAKAKDKQ